MKISTISCFEAFSKIIINKIKTDFVIIDFTPLKFPDVEIFIASFPFKGRSLPFYARILKKEDLDV
ncbi:MAG: hypothetical protein N2312_04930 [Dictyoglomaceae bacterium]|nr:hypothetical protein [Dictyoglomaceae bacterium]